MSSLNNIISNSDLIAFSDTSGNIVATNVKGALTESAVKIAENANYPFQPSATLNDAATKAILKAAIKRIEVYGADTTKNYAFMIYKEDATYGTRVYISECKSDGSLNQYVALTKYDLGVYSFPTGIEKFRINDFYSLGITANVWVNWSAIPNGVRYVISTWQKGGLDPKTLVLPINYVEQLDISLPTVINAVVGDTLELFYKGIVKAVDPFKYNIKVVGSQGKAYKRKWVYAPLSVIADFTLTFSVYDNQNSLLKTVTTTIHTVDAKSSPASNINILCIGDSLTDNGPWTSEFNRRLTAAGGVPIGKELANITFIGTTSTSGTANEGRTGYEYSDFLLPTSPFYNVGTSSIDFQNYCTVNSYSGIDYAIILLGWNSITTKTTAQIVAEGKTFVDQLHIDYPDCKVIISGLQVPSIDGLGENYGAHTDWNYYELLQKVFGLYTAYQAWVGEAGYSTFMKVVHLSSQFDTDNNMPSESRVVNVRSSVTDVVGTNGVHPATEGYYQICDAIYRLFMAY